MATQIIDTCANFRTGTNSSRTVGAAVANSNELYLQLRVLILSQAVQPAFHQVSAAGEPKSARQFGSYLTEGCGLEPDCSKFSTTPTPPDSRRPVLTI